MNSEGKNEVRRRHLSSTSVESHVSSGTSSGSSQASANKEKASPLDQPVHVAQDSLFSSSSGWTNYRGFFNLAILLLFVSNGRVALENIIKYGILISPLQWVHFISTDPWNWPNLALVVLSNITIILVLLMEKLLAMRLLNNICAFFFYFIVFGIHIVGPAVVTLRVQGNPLYSSGALSVYVILFLKLTSYVHVNYWCRKAQDHAKSDNKELPKNVMDYPGNINLWNMYYFVMAPTLCYELRYPRSPSRRKTFMIKRVCELVSLSLIIVALCQQWVAPLLRNSVGTFSAMNISHSVERVLKLAIPNHVIWLIFFYTIFHSALNLIAEILRFADRQFYLDFWNAETISVFWKTWNIPVHRWAVRHIYKPMVRNGYSKLSASFAVFFVSAFFHEYLVSVPLVMFRLWAYYAMMAQIPLSMLTDRVLKGGRAGNIVMWLSLILGQPMTILMYVHDWYMMHNPPGASNGTFLNDSTASL